MSADVTVVAAEKLAKLKAQISELEDEASTLEQFLQTYEALSRSTTGSPAHSGPPQPPKPPADISRSAQIECQAMFRAFSDGLESGLSKTQATLEAIEMLLSNRSMPLTPRDIYRQLRMANIPVSGKVPVNNVSAMLSNSKPRFDNSSGKGWTKRSGWYQDKERADKSRALQ